MYVCRRYEDAADDTTSKNVASKNNTLRRTDKKKL